MMDVFTVLAHIRAEQYIKCLVAFINLIFQLLSTCQEQGAGRVKRQEMVDGGNGQVKGAMHES